VASRSGYSYRSASTGSIRVTLRAGFHAAASATTIRISGTNKNTTGSRGLTPNRKLAIISALRVARRGRYGDQNRQEIGKLAKVRASITSNSHAVKELSAPTVQAEAGVPRQVLFLHSTDRHLKSYSLCAPLNPSARTRRVVVRGINHLHGTFGVQNAHSVCPPSHLIFVNY
jgi:hypothetical protein